tara:strand:- start:240 stop:431 length:192 start_codon:yes stop_codon:yes gene_type:complete
MKKSKITPKDFTNDLNKILKLISKIEDTDFENIEDKDLNKISKEIQKTDNFLKNKYKDLDTEK